MTPTKYKVPSLNDLYEKEKPSLLSLLLEHDVGPAVGEFNHTIFCAPSQSIEPIGSLSCEPAREVVGPGGPATKKKPK